MNHGYTKYAERTELTQHGKHGTDGKRTLEVLKELDAVAERIAKLESTTAGNWNSVCHVYTGVRKPSASIVEIIDQVRDVGFRLRAVTYVFGSDMKLTVTDL